MLANIVTRSGKSEWQEDSESQRTYLERNDGGRRWATGIVESESASGWSVASVFLPMQPIRHTNTSHTATRFSNHRILQTRSSLLPLAALTISRGYSKVPKAFDMVDVILLYANITSRQWLLFARLDRFIVSSRFVATPREIAGP